jgi:hypothetical protein
MSESNKHTFELIGLELFQSDLHEKVCHDWLFE